jgi:DNA-binding MarR family transcriptional regulator
MTYVSDFKRRIMQALRHGPLSLPEIAGEVDRAPYDVNAELRELRRERFIEDSFDRRAHIWRLTDRGHELVAAGDQLRLI